MLSETRGVENETLCEDRCGWWVVVCALTWCVKGGTKWGETTKVLDVESNSPNDQGLSSSRLIRVASFNSDFSKRSILLPNV